MRKLLQDFRIMVDNYYNDSNMGHDIYTDITNFIDSINESVEGRKPVTQGERFVELIDKDGRKNLIRVSAIVNIKSGGNLKFTCIKMVSGECYIEVDTKDNEEVLENLIADIIG